MAWQLTVLQTTIVVGQRVTLCKFKLRMHGKQSSSCSHVGNSMHGFSRVEAHGRFAVLQTRFDQHYRGSLSTADRELFCLNNGLNHFFFFSKTAPSGVWTFCIKCPGPSFGCKPFFSFRVWSLFGSWTFYSPIFSSLFCLWRTPF